MAEFVEHSIVSYEKDGLLSSSVLVDMGIKVNKPDVIAKIKELIDGFNETYVEAMDFLTNILPVAREKFGRSDNVLLPKTPSRKRGRPKNSLPEIPPKMQEAPPPRKRVTRNSRQNNPTEARNCPARNTRRQQKKSSVEQSKVAFIDDKQPTVVENDVKPSPMKESEKKSLTIKRASSTSPNTSNPVKKRSKPSIESVVDKDKSNEYTSVDTQSSSSLIIVEPGMKSSEAPVVDIVESDKIETDSIQTVNYIEFDNSKNFSEVIESSNSNSKATAKVDEQTAVLVSINKTACQASTVSTIEISSGQSNGSGELEVVSMANETTQKCMGEVKPPSPVPLRRSKRLSAQKPDEEIQVPTCKEMKEQLPEKVQQESSEELTSDSQDEAAPEHIVPQTPEEKPPRRSARLSKRHSVVSTGYKRHYSQKSSPWSAFNKTTLPSKQVEIDLNDVGIPENEDKGLPINDEHSSTESEDDGTVENGAKIASPAILAPTALPQSSKPDSSDEVLEPSAAGKVAELIQQIDGKNHDDAEQVICKTPNGESKPARKLGSFAQVYGSSYKPPNLLGGNIKSLIKQQSAQKYDKASELQQKRLELQRKEEKEREQKYLVELRRKKWAEEQKRKREEKQKRVAEAKAERERLEQERKQRQVAEKKELMSALEQARKKREHEEEAKRKLREQRTKEAEARRRKENEERLKRLREKEDEENMYRGMLKRKQEQEEQERKQRILEEKRLHEQKQRERQREQQDERERRLRELKETERKQREDVERKEKEDKERKIREQQEREKKRIAQLIKDKMAQETKLYEEKRQREEKERKEREEKRRREENRALQAKSGDTYLMTPPPAETRKPATNENYDISDIRSDESTDDEDCPRKKVPFWAQGALLKAALLDQDESRRIFEDLASGFVPHAPDLEKIFTKKRKRFYHRTSSAQWNIPPVRNEGL